MNVLIWYKRDLRVEDHPALRLGAGMGAVLPLYIAEPDYWALPDTSARQWALVAETLAGLRRDLAGLGAPLVVRLGEAVEVLARLCRQNKITQIISHQECGNAWTEARNKRVADWAKAAGIDWVELPQAGPRGVAAAPAAVIEGDVVVDMGPDMGPAPEGLRMVAGVEPGVIPNARALRMPGDDCPHRQAGGRAQGLALLESFLGQRGLGYRQMSGSPLGAERACSRLSPYLAVGALSAREVELATHARLATRPGPDWGQSLKAFQTRLLWRAQLSQKLKDAPHIEQHAECAAAGALPGRMQDGARFEAWCKGQTGLPYLDACMRYLIATGWINFQARAMLASVASYHLWLDWRAVGQVLARRFTDYDPGIHWPQIQIHAGISRASRLQICDPVKQGLEQDPTGSFTRRWVPELAGVPDEFLQMPWKWPGAQAILGRRYPEPVVDLANAAREARAALGPLRRAEGMAQGAVILIEPPCGPRRPRLYAASGQLCLDL